MGLFGPKGYGPVYVGKVRWEIKLAYEYVDRKIHPRTWRDIVDAMLYTIHALLGKRLICMKSMSSPQTYRKKPLTNPNRNASIIRINTVRHFKVSDQVTPDVIMLQLSTRLANMIRCDLITCVRTGGKRAHNT